MNDRITLTFPASTENIRLARLVVAGLAARVGFDVDAIDDLRIAVNELCSLLIDTAPASADVELVFNVAGDRIQVSGSAPADGEPAGPDELVSQVLKVAVDHFELGQDAERSSFEIIKRLVA